MSLAGTLPSNPAAARWDVVMFRVLEFGGKTRTSNFTIAINSWSERARWAQCERYQHKWRRDNASQRTRLLSTHKAKHLTISMVIRGKMSTAQKIPAQKACPFRGDFTSPRLSSAKEIPPSHSRGKSRFTAKSPCLVQDCSARSLLSYSRSRRIALRRCNLGKVC